MINRRCVICSIIFLLMFPLCFQVVGLLRQSLTDISIFEVKNFARMYSFQILIEGILSGIFIVLMMTLYRKMKESCFAGKWIALAIVWLNHLYSVLTLHLPLPEMAYTYFWYFTSRTYMMLIIMLAFFIIVDIIKDIKQSR